MLEQSGSNKVEGLIDGTYYKDGIRWLCNNKIVEIHDQMISLMPGEARGIRDTGLLASACGRPALTRYYEQNEDVFMLAAVLGEAICKNHPFHNANKRTAAQAVYVFLLVNGYEFSGPENEVVIAYEGIACDQISREELTEWLATWSIPFDTPFLNE